MNLSDKN